VILCFELSMPGCASWNGRWSGEGRAYLLVKNLGTSQKAKARGLEILQKRTFGYSWPDGWRASISVKEVTSQEARRLRKLSAGFCGYSWMVDSILRVGEITTD
jgi:hypothetical protein